jgi:hypothetical protein
MNYWRLLFYCHTTCCNNTVQVHGGTTANDIIRKVHQAATVAARMRKEYSPNAVTVLFFDEANTTEAISLIKEIMTDQTIQGRPLPQLHGLKIIAACNPYRRWALIA